MTVCNYLAASKEKCSDLCLRPALSSSGKELFTSICPCTAACNGLISFAWQALRAIRKHDHKRKSILKNYIRNARDRPFLMGKGTRDLGVLLNNEKFLSKESLTSRALLGSMLSIFARASVEATTLAYSWLLPTPTSLEYTASPLAWNTAWQLSTFFTTALLLLQSSARMLMGNPDSISTCQWIRLKCMNPQLLNSGSLQWASGSVGSFWSK